MGIATYPLRELFGDPRSHLLTDHRSTVDECLDIYHSLRVNFPKAMPVCRYLSWKRAAVSASSVYS